MSNEIKIRYQPNCGESLLGVAYVSEICPHVGIDKHTEDKIEVYFSAAFQQWMEKTSKFFICHCEPCDKDFERKMLKHGNITQVNEF